eukprot:scaffold293780_cov19-Prasinocladus_malaysianus.AAC.1
MKQVNEHQFFRRFKKAFGTCLLCPMRKASAHMRIGAAKLAIDNSKSLPKCHIIIASSGRCKGNGWERGDLPRLQATPSLRECVLVEPDDIDMVLAFIESSASRWSRQGVTRFR